MKDILKEYIKSIPSDDIGIFLSGGMDSILLLLILKELKKNVHAYSFTKSDRISSDFIKAEAICKILDVKFTGFRLDMSRETLLEYIIEIKKKYKIKKKTEIECVFPFYMMRELIEENYIISGHAADGHYCISKKGMLHFRDNIDEFRSNYFSNPNVAQNNTLSKIYSDIGKRFYFPYITNNVINFFMGKSWDECNKPKQKQITRDAIASSDFNFNFRLDNHTNLQLGDSGIAEGFNILLEGTNFKSPIAIYNRL